MNTKRFLVRIGGDKFDLRKLDPDFTDRHKKKEQAAVSLKGNLKELRRLQDVLFAQGKYGVLIVLQGMDTSGKDSLSKYLMRGLNPAGCRVHSFKAPSVEELEQDFLRRYVESAPSRGEMVIFNRSHYEEVGVVRVHPELLAKQNLPDEIRNEKIWEYRFRQIRGLEHYLTENGIMVLKFFLRISKEEQEKRLLERVEDDTKNWKFSMRDVHERGFWEDYMRVYSQALSATSTNHAPWYAIPTNHKWFAKLVIGEIVLEHLRRLPLEYPQLDKKEHGAALEALKKSLKRK